MVEVGQNSTRLGSPSMVEGFGRTIAKVGRLVGMVTFGAAGVFAASAVAFGGGLKALTQAANGDFLTAGKQLLVTAGSAAFELVTMPFKSIAEFGSLIFTGKFLGTHAEDVIAVGTDAAENAAHKFNNRPVGNNVTRAFPASVGSVNGYDLAAPAAGYSNNYWQNQVRPQNQQGLVAAPTGQPVFANAGSKAEQIMASRAAQNDPNYVQSQLVNG